MNDKVRLCCECGQKLELDVPDYGQMMCSVCQSKGIESLSEREVEMVNEQEKAIVVVPEGIEVDEFAEKQMIEINEFLAKIEDKETQGRLKRSLETAFDTILRIKVNYPDHPCSLQKDSVPLSFTFNVGSLFGGLTFHGSHDDFGSGGVPTFSVRLTPTEGWSIHT